MHNKLTRHSIGRHHDRSFPVRRRRRESRRLGLHLFREKIPETKFPGALLLVVVVVAVVVIAAIFFIPAPGL
jgi:hypothetical protein